MNRFILSSFTLLLIFSNQLTFAQDQTYSKKHYNLKNGLAIQGYDPVAYFTDGKAIEGSKSITFNKDGITYRFSSEAHKKAFISNPSKYEPQYGGYCAYAMADGDKVRIDPETFKIVDDKLYLFYNFRFTNTLKSWNKDEGNLLPKANNKWVKIISGR